MSYNFQKNYWNIKFNFVLGSLATSVFDSNVYLVGASGGVYALLAAHLANVMLVRSLNCILLVSKLIQ